jgi:hypothetical protein
MLAFGHRWSAVKRSWAVRLALLGSLLRPRAVDLETV